MSSCASFIFLFLISFLISFRASAQNPKFLYRYCPNTTTYSRNSTYFTNLRTLLSSLSSPDASYSTGFQNATTGNDPDRVTGLFLCRGDLSPEACRNCVAFSVNQTLTRCPNEREVVLYYDECMLRYSHRNILSTVTYRRGYIMLNSNNISSNQEERFVDAVASTLNRAATEAANSSRKFATIKVNWTALQSLYVLVQCTPDLTRNNCIDCLRRSIYRIPHNRYGGRLLSPSCNSRYELYSFYNETAVRTPPPPPSPPSTSPVSSPPRPGKGGNSNAIAVAIVVPIIVVVLLFIACYCFFAKRTKKTSDTAPAFDAGYDITTIDSLQLDYRTIQAATNDYSENNKIGRGGFGVVYKGTLPDGTEVAVKRLSKSSGQGDTEFKNEVVVVAKLQHRNLVRLLGFSLEREERILVYEYVANKSLDYFLFDPARQGQLDWTRRYKIIGGIARGILYLHQDSRLTIIHRDLKASNILLDTNMNPKISDFGLATIFGVDQTRGNTNRIVGTYAYMSPEYALHGQYSMKSDIYSFGVLVLEIISGKKNSGVYQMDETSTAGNLVTYVWKLWRNGSPLELVDPAIGRNYQSSEVTRCIHIALLCIQENPEDRPMLSTIILMLGSNSSTLPVPRLPGFLPRSRHVSEGLETSQSTGRSVPYSVNDVSITDLEPR